MTDAAPKGRQFRLVYGERGEPLPDAARMRTRIGAVLDQLPDYGSEVAQAADRKLGEPIPGWTIVGSWRNALPKWRIDDVLSLVTIVFQAIRAAQLKDTHGKKWPDPALAFLREIQEIFDEENVHYQVDEQGGVHYKHDRAFNDEVVSTIAALTGGRYANARTEFERARTEMLKAAPDGKQALRSIFTSAEGLFKLMFPNERRLTADSAQRLSGVIARLAGEDVTARDSAIKALNGLKDWVAAMHNYRHEQGTPEPVQPPLPLALNLFSTGVAHIRWLAELDALENSG